MNRRVNKVIAIFAVVVLASFMIVFTSCSSEQPNAAIEHDVETPILYDKPAEYVFDEKQDLQMPELPTGCEATALGTLLRMNGVNVTKFDVANAMPKSDGSDFVYSFWGNPYSATDGWACMAPCSVITANKFLKNSNKIAVEYTGTDLMDLKFPSAVWVTMYLNDPQPSNYESNGYRLFRNPHCVVVDRIELDSVYVIDPLVGEVAYPLERFNNVYKELGCQAVCIETAKK